MSRSIYSKQETLGLRGSPGIENLDLDLFRIKFIFRKFPVAEMQFSNCENMCISFKRKHNQEIKGKKQVRLSMRFYAVFSFGFARNSLCAFSNY